MRPHICLPTAYAYPRLAPVGSTWTGLCLWQPSQALAAVCMACSLKVSFSSSHNPKYFRAVQSLIYSSFRWGGRTEQTTMCKQHHLWFLVPRLSPPTGSNGSYTQGWWLPSARAGDIVFYHNHQGIIGITDDIYHWWDFLFQDVVNRYGPRIDPCGTPYVIPYCTKLDAVYANITQSWQ